MDWAERVAMLFRNPDAATRDDVSMMAAELMATWNPTTAMPDGCQCDPGEWDEVTPICGKFQGESGKHCERCAHDEACHGVTHG